MTAREMHARAREIHAKARANHVAVCGGWNREVKVSTGSWDDGEDPGGVRRSCGGTKVYKSDLEKTKVEYHHRTENGTIARGGKRPEEAD